MLQKDTHNRKHRPSAVTKLAHAIRNGEWVFNAQPIQIAIDGTILDGGHRLRACVEANKPIDVLVVRNASFESQNTMDMGVSRNVADILTLEGFKESKALAAFAVRILTLEKQSLNKMMHGDNRNVTPGEILTFCRAFDGQARYIRNALETGKRLRIPGTIIGSAMWITDNLDAQDSEFFWERFRSGLKLEEGSPILGLRNWALDPSRELRTGGSAYTNVYAHIFKAWNKYRAGETAARIQWKPGGSRPEAFPEPK